MRFFFGVLRVSVFLVVAAVSLTAANAQNDDDDNDSSSPTSCADVMPLAIDTQDRIQNVSIYRIRPHHSGHRAKCLAMEALSEGMVDVELGEDRFLARLLGDPGPETVNGKVSEFPYSAPGSRPTPGQPPPGPSPEATDHAHVYAAFIDPGTGVEYTFSSVAENLDDAEAAGVEWVKSTIEPLVKKITAKPAAQDANSGMDPAARATFAAAVVTDAAAKATVPPDYNPLAWRLLRDATIRMPDNRPPGKINEFGQHWDRPLGESGIVMRVYRFNATVAGNEYFLVDTAYTQTPEYKPFPVTAFSYVSARIATWANRETVFALRGIDPNHDSTEVDLREFAPQTLNSSSSVTFTVGGNLTLDLSGPSGSVSADYSVTREQPDVETVVRATVGQPNIVWTDVYSRGALFAGPPAALVQTFTGERLAVFKVPQSVNLNVPQGKLAGISFYPDLESHVFGVVQTTSLLGLIENRDIFASWAINSGGGVFVKEPMLSASPLNIQVSKSQNSAKNPVRVSVSADLTVKWTATKTPSFVSTNVNADGITGNKELEIWPTSEAKVDDSGKIFLDTIPAGAVDSVRNGAIEITVTVVK